MCISFFGKHLLVFSQDLLLPLDLLHYNPSLPPFQKSFENISKFFLQDQDLPPCSNIKLAIFHLRPSPATRPTSGPLIILPPPQSSNIFSKFSYKTCCFSGNIPRCDKLPYLDLQLVLVKWGWMVELLVAVTKLLMSVTKLLMSVIRLLIGVGDRF